MTIHGDHLLCANRVEEAFRECLLRARDLGASLDALPLYETALELWTRVPAPESVIGTRDGVRAGRRRRPVARRQGARTAIH